MGNNVLYHSTVQIKLNCLNENTQLPAQPSASTSPSYIPPGSSQNPLHETPTKILPLDQILLQTPPKNIEIPKNSKGDDSIM